MGGSRSAWQHFMDACDHVRPRLACILGSGLNDLVDQLDAPVKVPFAELPGFATTSVAGHRGIVTLGFWRGVPVLLAAGRLHGYEGHAPDQQLATVRLLATLRVTAVIATNAAGGLRPDLTPGTLMLLTSHVDGIGPTWWRDLPAQHHMPYDAGWGQLLQQVAIEQGVKLARGVYAQLPGPSYETPAEIRALRTLGVDAVGMSTGREMAEARRLGMTCAALSCITNRAAGLSAEPIRHDDVLAVGARLRDTLGHLLAEVVQRGAR
jgi:purine-nucleoside phosphorylase